MKVKCSVKGIKEDVNQLRNKGSYRAKIYVCFDNDEAGKKATLKAIEKLNKIDTRCNEQKEIIIVEGQLDCISLHQAGFTNTVAVQGGVLTDEHCKIIQDIICSDDIINLDMEEVYFWLHMEKEWKETNIRRNFVQELLETDSKLASYISNISTDEKVVKKVQRYVKQKKHPEYVDVDIRDIMADVSLKDHIEAVWNTRFNMNACRCCLPDHKDKTASFHIYPNTNSFYCFGCHAGGSMIDFLMTNDKMTKVQAINYIKSCSSQIPHHSRRSTGEQKLF